MPAPKSVAAIVTTYHKWSHADVILRNLLDGYPPDGTSRPNLRLVSLFTDQLHKADLGRALAKKHGVRLSGTIADALTLGTNTLAVDAVLSIGEHGTYPDNEQGQKLYPRRRFFEEVVKVFGKTGRAVPVFNDKHLAATWADAKWVYDAARKHYAPFMAGSSIPVTWRRPNLVLPRDCELTGAVQIGYGPLEGYGFHALEGLQCMVERRKPSGGRQPPAVPQQGVTAVTCHTGPAMWAALDRQAWAGPLLAAALKRVPAHATADMRAVTAKAKDAAVFEVEYRDGLRAFVVIPNGWIHEGDGGGFIFAGQVTGDPQPSACHFYLQQPDPFAHFAELTKAIDSFVQTGHAPYPVERTLLTTGVLDAAMTSRFRRGERVETPHLDVTYRATDWGPAAGDVPKPAKK